MKPFSGIKEKKEMNQELLRKNSCQEMPTSNDDESKFITLFVQHQSSVRSFITTIVPVGVDADEILQDASLTMWRKFDQFVEGTSFRNWAFQIAKFTAFNHIRRVKRERLVFESSLVELIAQDIERFDSALDARRAALKHCRSKLSQKDATMLVGCYETKSTIDQYAKSVSRTPNAVYKHLDRVRKGLLSCINKVVGELV